MLPGIWSSPLSVLIRSHHAADGQHPAFPEASRSTGIYGILVVVQTGLSGLIV